MVSECSAWAWRTSAPISTAPSSTVMPSRPETSLMSTSNDGLDKRMLRLATRLWPPASGSNNQTMAPAKGACRQSFRSPRNHAADQMILAAFARRTDRTAIHRRERLAASTLRVVIRLGGTDIDVFSPQIRESAMPIPDPRPTLQAPDDDPYLWLE